LRKDYFVSVGLIHLEFLTFKYNVIIVVEPGAFNGLPGLKDLHLQSNNISTLQPRKFSNLIDLLGLDIGYNEIQILPSGVFLGLENLEYVSLAHNQIEELHEGIFMGLSNLRNHWLSGNRISQLHSDVFRLMPKLYLISFSGNKNLFLQTDRPFLNTSSLRRCIFSGCNITTLSAKSFKMSPNLEYLDLEDTSLKTTDVQMLKSLPGLKELYLFKSPLHRDCRLQQVWQWCRKYEVTTGHWDEVPKCHSPDDVSGLWWGVLGQAQCSEGKIEFQGDYKSFVYEYVPDVIEQHWDFVMYVESSVYGLMFLVGAVGNITVMIIIGCNKRTRTVPNAYIFYLAVGDLLSP
jgi:Leucine-rich repeat (LRR) protein